MSKIQSPPRGLQDLLGTQNFGSNPNELAQVVQPVVNMGNFYTLDKTFIPRANNASGPPSANDRLFIEVPSGEMWYVSKIFAAVTQLLFAQDWRSRCYIELNQRSSLPTDQDAFLLDKEIEYIATQSSATYETVNYDLDMWLPSGSQINHQFLGGTNVDAGVKWAVGALAIRLRN